MPRVPTYDNFQVAQASQPNAQFSAPTMPDVIGQQTAQINQGIERTGAAIARIGQDIQNEANRAREIEAADQLERTRLKLTYDPQGGFVHLKGDNALRPSKDKSLTSMYGEQFDSAMSEIEAGLGNDAQKAAFRQQAIRMRAQFNADMTRHVASEFETQRKAVFAGAVETSVQGAALEWGDAGKVAVHAQKARDSIGQLAVIGGLGGAEAEALKVKGMSQLHSAVLANAIQAGNLDYAREYLTQNTRELSPEARLQMTKALEQGDKDRIVFGKTDQLWASSGGDLTKALDGAKSVDARYRGDVERQLRTYAHDAEAARAADAKRTTDTAWEIIVRDGSRKNLPAGWWGEGGKLDGAEQRQITDWLEAKARQREAVAKGKFEPDLETYQKLIRMSVDDPAAFMNLNFQRFEPVLGDNITKQLIDMSGRMSKKDAQADSEQRLMRTALALGDAQIRNAGINLRAKPGSNDAKKAAEFTTELQAEISALRESGKADEQSVKAAVMRLTADWYKRGTWFGYNSKKGYQIPAGEMGDYVAKPFRDIPQATRDAIRQSFVAGGARPTEVTDQMIERAYTRAFLAGEVQ